MAVNAEVATDSMAPTTGAAGRLETAPTPEEEPGPRPRRWARRPPRPAWTVRGISPWSVLRLSAALSLFCVPLALAAAAGLWLLASSTGMIAGLEDFLGELLAVRDFRLEPVRLLGLGALVGYGLAVAATLVALAAVLLYNTAARLGAGIQLRLAEPEAQTAEPIGPAGEENGRP